MTPAALAALHARSMDFPEPFSEAEFTTLLIAPGVFVLGDADGFALGRVAADEAELLTIAVAPEARRRGRGRDLLQDFQAEAGRRGAAQAFLEVAEDNTPARSLYTAAGWTEVGRRRGYYTLPGGGRADALVLRKSLSEAV